MRAVKPPNPKLPTIQPFEADEIRKLLRQTSQGETAELRLRGRTLILFLLDIGVWVSELINLRIREADLRMVTALVQGTGRLYSGQGKQRPSFRRQAMLSEIMRMTSQHQQLLPSRLQHLKIRLNLSNWPWFSTRALRGAIFSD